MNKNRTKVICMQMVEKLDCIINELDKKTPYYGYMDEKLKAVENDINCVREEINTTNLTVLAVPNGTEPTKKI